jgi:hypothetical protein
LYVDWIYNLTSTMPYMVAPGNHESECHSPACLVDLLGKGEKLKNFTAYNARWGMPSAQSGGVDAMWYSWNQGAIHFVSCNSETDFKGAGEEKHGDSGVLPAGGFAPDGEYLKWLEADLAAARAPGSKTKWIIAGAHRPFGDIAASHGPLFARYGVEAYFAGHSHSYSRSGPSTSLDVPTAAEVEAGARAARSTEYGAVSGARGTAQSDGVVINTTATNGTLYVVVGGAGCDEMPLKVKVDDAVGADGGAVLRHRPTAALAPRGAAGPAPYATDVMASGVLKVFNSTAIRWQLLRSVDGVVLDEVWLTK